LEFDEAQRAAAYQSLIGQGSEDLIEFMHRKSLGWETHSLSCKALDTAIALGWLIPERHTLTEIGRLVADACREYSFWRQRDRQLPFEKGAPHLNPATLLGRSVLEIGSGMGVNLMSLSMHGVSVSGVEPMQAYAQVGAILFEREELPVPDMQQGTAEELPFADQCFDVALCVSAHQYFDLRSAFVDIARVLKPGGEMIIIGATFKTYVVGGFWDVLRGDIGAKTYTITTTDTFWHELLGSRIVPTRSGFSTARPVYASRKTLNRLARRSGFAQASPPVMIDSETVFHFRLV
jgi:ubiquinone/menaquinone biosynthesis C-methylase UbiE